MRDVHLYLNSLPMFGTVGISAANYSLDAIRAAMLALGHPQNTFPSIHVAGTNGKGSVCHMLASVYQHGGYRTGLYSSPHLMRVNERVNVNGDVIPDQAMQEFMDLIEPFIAVQPLTYFEFTTAMAFWWFAQCRVDVAIVETGLGGRLDATNILNPVCGIVTSIGMDHAEILGPTLSHIAQEKAAILKPGMKRRIVGPVPEECRAVFTAIPETTFITEPDTSYRTDLDSAHSGWNIAMVKAALVLPVDEAALVQGLSAVRETTGFRARFEKLHPKRDWYFDGAHNEDALRALEAYITNRFPDEPQHWVMAVMKDKLTPGVIDFMNERDGLMLVELDSPRAATIEDLKQMGISATRIYGPERLSELKLVILAGSFYFYGTAMHWMKQISDA